MDSLFCIEFQLLLLQGFEFNFFDEILEIFRFVLVLRFKHVLGRELNKLDNEEHLNPRKSSSSSHPYLKTFHLPKIILMKNGNERISTQK